MKFIEAVEFVRGEKGRSATRPATVFAGASKSKTAMTKARIAFALWCGVLVALLVLSVTDCDAWQEKSEGFGCAAYVEKGNDDG